MQADVDRFVDDGSLDDNVESFLAHDDGDPRDAVGRNVDGNKGTICLFLSLSFCEHLEILSQVLKFDHDIGFSFSEVRCITASTSKVECCHFSSDGKLLATGGQDKKVWMNIPKRFCY